MLLAAAHVGGDLAKVNLTQTSFHTQVRSAQSKVNFLPSCCEGVDPFFFFFFCRWLPLLGPAIVTATGGTFE